MLSVGLREISNLETCTALIELSLAWNNLSCIKGLESLVLLKRLDLSHNKIKQIGGGLAALTSLQWLDLNDNLLDNVSDIAHLKPLTQLQNLTFQSCDGEECNPMCLTPTYSLSTIRKTLPHLVTLDGGHVLVHEAFEEIERASTVGPEAPTLDPPNEPWFDPQELLVEDDAVLASVRVKVGVKVDGMGGVAEGLTRTTEMLTTDCAMLLRKADAAIGKANKT